jgi:ankyrin repeat protein
VPRADVGVLLFFLSFTAACTETRIAGITVEQAFPNPKAAALAKAGCEGDIARIKQLAADGVLVEAKGKDDIHPLLWAMECHSHAGVKTLLELGADPNYVYGGHASAIWIAAREPDVEMLQLFIAHGGDLNRRYNDDSPLMRAITLGTQTGYWKNYYLLLDAGADINQPGELNRTVAEYANTLGQMDKIAELLRRGYSYHLHDLMALVQNVVVDDAHEADRLRVIEILKERGIRPFTKEELANGLSAISEEEKKTWK